MSSKKKPTGVNKAIQQGTPIEKLESRVICKNCGKDIEFKKTVRLHLKCPRCSQPLERDINKEYKQANRIIRYDLFRRSKKYFLHIGLVFAAIALAYNIIGFFTQVFANHGWWLALVSIPFVLLSLFLMSYARLKNTTSKKLRILSWSIIILNFLAVAAIVITAVPYLNERLLEWYSV